MSRVNRNTPVARTAKPLAQLPMGLFEIRVLLRILAETEALVEERNNPQLIANVLF